MIIYIFVRNTFRYCSEIVFVISTIFFRPLKEKCLLFHLRQIEIVNKVKSKIHDKDNVLFLECSERKAIRRLKFRIIIKEFVQATP